MSDILKEVSNKVIENDGIWGHESDDTKNDPFLWMGVIARTSSSWMAGEYEPFSKERVDAFRAAMLDTAAVAIAAIESIDRQRENNGVTFFEEETT